MIFKIEQVPWKRPDTTKLNSKSLINPLKADLNEKVRNTFIAKTIESKLVNKFPLQEQVAVAIAVYSSYPCTLPLLAKNILDSMNNLLYTDDIHVSSLICEINYSTLNRIDVLIPSRPHITSYTPIETLRENSIISFSIKSYPYDKVLHIPSNPYIHMLPNTDNIAQQLLISNILSKQQFIGNLVTDDVLIKLNINTMSNESDIDNIALNYIFALDGLVLQSLYQIKCIIFNIYRNKPDCCLMDIIPLVKH